MFQEERFIIIYKNRYEHYAHTDCKALYMLLDKIFQKTRAFNIDTISVTII